MDEMTEARWCLFQLYMNFLQKFSGKHHVVVFLGLGLFQVGVWLSHVKLVLESGADSLAIAEHRLIPAKVRSPAWELRKVGCQSVWYLADHSVSNVGAPGEGVVSIIRRSALSSPSFATLEFQAVCNVGRAIQCLLLVSSGRVFAPACCLRV